MKTIWLKVILRTLFLSPSINSLLHRVFKFLRKF